MLVTVFESHWFPQGADVRVVLDPTRMAQGIMTGIGFVGAGAIIKDGLTVRGLTTAASIWVTSAIGVLTGIGFYFAAFVATLLALGTLSLFRWIEARLPTESYANFVVRFRRSAVIPEPALRELVAAHNFRLYNLSFRLLGEEDQFEYRMVLRTLDPSNLRKLSDTLAGTSSVLEFRLAPTSE